ncbi:hypothetical protein WKV44_03385 [Spirochaetia bacterium 38H-sp]|uniref:Uncharacterized protein n=1 Tax=Rarispira pelagica TaxID=3141764 RepID=A0ABU9UA91_9SPIR
MGKTGSTVSSRAKKIHCANCKHCKLTSEAKESGTGYDIKVRCARGQWRKKMGDEKLYRFSTVMRRIVYDCEYYEPMGDEAEFLKELKRTLPVHDDNPGSLSN